MISKILNGFGIDVFGFVPVSLCRPANIRLYSSLPESCNAIFLLIPYYTEGAAGILSKYACVHDYHYFARSVFDTLSEYFKNTYPKNYFAAFADHSPLSECDGAARAGLGVIGENSLLISEKYSSFVFIGEIITDLSRDALLSEGISEGDGKARHCYNCGLCKKACPAGVCGTESREGCISSVTQKKGELSEEERKAIEKSATIWGCDSCQNVCPYTKKASDSGSIYTSIDYFKNSVIHGDPLEAIPKMDDGEFKKYPFAWRKRGPIERNIKILKGEQS